MCSGHDAVRCTTALAPLVIVLLFLPLRHYVHVKAASAPKAMYRVATGPYWVAKRPQLNFTQPRSRCNLLDGCQHVYLDLGTNVGVQASLVNVIPVRRYC